MLIYGLPIQQDSSMALSHKHSNHFKTEFPLGEVPFFYALLIKFFVYFDKL